MHVLILFLTIALAPGLDASTPPLRVKDAMVVSQNHTASEVGLQVLQEGGNAMDAAVATAFALAVTLPRAGNIGGGGFLLWRDTEGKANFIDFRETAPALASPAMFLNHGKYNATLHHESHQSVGVPGTVAGLHMAWKLHGHLPWRRLVAPAVTLAKKGFVVTPCLAKDLKEHLSLFKQHPATLKQFTQRGRPIKAASSSCKRT